MAFDEFCDIFCVELDDCFCDGADIRLFCNKSDCIDGKLDIEFDEDAEDCDGVFIDDLCVVSCRTLFDNDVDGLFEALSKSSFGADTGVDITDKYGSEYINVYSLYHKLQNNKDTK